MGLKIYTDGAYSSSRDQGGWAYVIVRDDTLIFKKSGLAVGTKTEKVTNNTMEMMAVIRAIKDTYNIVRNNKIKIDLISDSLYVLNTLKKVYKIKSNEELWKEIIDLDISNYNLIHVRGHQGNKFNEVCDELAVHQSQVIKL